MENLGHFLIPKWEHFHLFFKLNFSGGVNNVIMVCI